MIIENSTIARHRSAVLATVDVEAIKRRKFIVAVDCVNGAASLATPAFLRELGCEVIAINVDPMQPFPHDPEPIPENITHLCGLMRSINADIGFVQDADADRLAVVNEKGEPLGEECTLALAARHMLRRAPGRWW